MVNILVALKSDVLPNYFSYADRFVAQTYKPFILINLIDLLRKYSFI